MTKETIPQVDPSRCNAPLEGYQQLRGYCGESYASNSAGRRWQSAEQNTAGSSIALRIAGAKANNLNKLDRGSLKPRRT